MAEVLIFCTSGMRHCFRGELHDEVVYAFSQTRNPNLRPRFVTVVKEDEYGEGAAILKLEELERDGLIEACEVLVVVPSQSAHIASWVAERQVQRRRSKKPLLVIALTLPFHGNAFHSRGLPDPPVVISNNKHGAVQLGMHAASSFDGNIPPDGVHVALLPGRKGQIDSNDRLASFMDGFKEVLSEHDLHEITLEECQWSRRKADDVVRRYLESGRAERIDVLFAANDDAALGARDALKLLRMTKPDVVGRTRVFGYDAIEEAWRLIEGGDQLLCGTVCQNLDEMARQLAKLAAKLIEDPNGQIKPGEISIAPTMIVGSNAVSPMGPDIPPLDQDEWIDVRAAAAYIGITPEALRTSRARARARYRDPEGKSGIDAVGRNWRAEKAGGKVWYLKRSLIRR